MNGPFYDVDGYLVGELDGQWEIWSPAANLVGAFNTWLECWADLVEYAQRVHDRMPRMTLITPMAGPQMTSTCSCGEIHPTGCEAPCSICDYHEFAGGLYQPHRRMVWLDGQPADDPGYVRP